MKAGLVAAGLISATIMSAQAGTVLRYVEGSPNRGAKSEALMVFAKEVSEATGGELEIEIHWGGALLKWAAILPGVSIGTADMGTLVGPYAPKELMAMGIGDLPIGEAGDPWVGSRAMHELMTTNSDMIKAFDKQNVIYLGAIHTTAAQLMCNDDSGVSTLADLKGKKVRSAGIYAHALSDLGATPVSVSFGEIYQALDSGLLDCSLVYLYTLNPYKFWEVIDKVIKIDWGQVAGIAASINKDVWSGLTEEQRSVLREAGSKMVDTQAQKLIAQTNETIEAIEQNKYGRPVKLVQASAEDKAALDNASEKYIKDWMDKFSAEGYDAQAVMDQYVALLNKYAKERDDKGYPWDR